MKRILFSSPSKCKYNCVYCFAKLGNYDKYFCDKNKSDKFDIMYPSCDGELDSIDFKFLIKYVENRKKPVVVAISTKSKINKKYLNYFLKLNNVLKSKGGFLKIGITITNKNFIEDLEKGSCSFEDRINNLKLLKDNNIFSFVIIRPILPWLDKMEFKEIIDETKMFSNYYLLGDLYVFKNSSFYKKYIKDKFVVKRKKVNWLKNMPEWYMVENINLKRYIKNYLKTERLMCFESDLELINYCFLKN